MTSVIWKPIPDFPDYLVSDMGDVRSLKWGKDRLLKPGKNVDGYLRVVLSNGSERASRLIHQLILLSFAGPRPDGMVTRHTNGNSTDNHLENLKYGTQKENTGDTVLHGNHQMAKKTECKRGHPFNLENTYISVNSSGGVGRSCKTCKNMHVRNYRRKGSDG